MLRCPQCETPEPRVMIVHKEVVLTSYPVALDDIGGTLIAGIDGEAEEHTVITTLDDDDPSFRCFHCGLTTQRADDFLDKTDQEC